MSAVRSCELPQQALLQHYRRQGAYADCFVAVLPRSVTQAQYVEAFYGSTLFRLERLLLALFVARPSTDLQARRLAAGELDAFAAWRVERRGPGQLLLADFTGRTRSWLMSTPSAPGEPPGTRLYFGSAVVPAPGRAGMGLPFRALLGFHKLYSRALLRAAASRLARACPP